MIGNVNTIPFISTIGGIGSLPAYIVYLDGEVPEIITTVTYTQGSRSIRKRVVGGEYHIDITLTSTGFSGVEGVDWKQIDPDIEGQTDGYRNGSRDGYFYMDCEITPTGFSGVEDVDWEWVSRSKHPTSTQTTFRDGLRSGSYVIDQELTSTGFSGTRGIDWINLKTYNI